MAIIDIDSFLNVNKDDIHDPLLMKNMWIGTCLLYHILKLEKPRIRIIIDPDVDGFTSSSMMIQFIKTIKPEVEITYSLDFNKRHGLYLDKIDSEYDLIIVPDASFGDEEVAKQITTPTLILDHHQYQEWQTDYTATYINCNDEDYPNPHLSGVGVVQKFIEAYVDTYKLDE